MPNVTRAERLGTTPDEAMHIAKGRGKNRVVMWSPPAGPGGADAVQSRSGAPSGNSAR